MSATKQELQSILERVENAAGPDRELDAALTEYFGPIDDLPMGLTCGKAKISDSAHYFTGSVDAALVLVDRVLPGQTAGWQPGIGNRAWATIYRVAENEVGMVEKANHATLPLAILAALLKALITQADEVEG